MPDDKFHNIYRISPARAPWHNYDGGAYFVTICTHNREHFFGEIIVSTDTKHTDMQSVEVQMRLSAIGQYACDQFSNVGEHYPYAEIPLFVVMPDHIHAIVMVDGRKTPYPRRCVSDNGNGSDAVLRHPDCEETHNSNNGCDVGNNVSTSQNMKRTANMQGWLSVVVGGLKRSVTRYANEQKIPFAWQTRFYDRIIRNQDELHRIALYIEQNVAQWGKNASEH